MGSNSNAADASLAPLLVPISGATLFAQESTRRRNLRQKGAIPTGCPEIDDVLLLGGGFERGCVVGVSAEDVNFGVLVSFYSSCKAAIITTLPTTTILPTLRDVVRSQVQSKLGPRNPGVDAELRRTLEAISISRIFDVEGLWEVLREVVTELPPLRIGSELQPLVRKSEILDSEDEEPFSSSPLSSPPPSTAAPGSVSPPREQNPQSPAGADSQPTPVPEQEVGSGEFETPSPSPIVTENPPEPASIPGMILVTHFSSLLATLFTHTDKTTAHTRLQLLASYLHNLSRRPAEPLIMLLNSTISPSPDTSTATSAPPDPGPSPPHDPRDARQHHHHQQPLDPTLRSIFNPGPAQLPLQNYGTGHNHRNENRYGYGYPYPYGAAAVGAASTRLTRRNKPSFGATFAQFLELHLLCTAVPCTREDAEVAVALGVGGGGGGGGEDGGGDVRRVWVVEVLLDELGFWELETGKEIGKEKGKGKGMGKRIGEGSHGRGKDDIKDEYGDDNARLPTRVNREQRWAAVDVRDQLRVVNAFAAGAGAGIAGVSVRRGPIRLAAGFGGPRV
ncbi:hypothetical protein F5B17DRAFT_444578 [Nemania serpens]|nr:hypothetical protein F5B17DRAFT_444578 [Nemania serpens]